MGLGDMLIKGTKYALENQDKIRDKIDKSCDVLEDIGETQRNIAKVEKGIKKVAGKKVVAGGIDATIGTIKGKKFGKKTVKGLK